VQSKSFEYQRHMKDSGDNKKMKEKRA